MSGIFTYPSGATRVAQVIGSSGAHNSLGSGDFGCDAKTLTATATAGQMQTILSITGSGAIKALAMQGPLGGGTTTMRMRLTLDGLVVLDRTLSLPVNASLVGIGFPSTMYTGGSPLYEVIGIAPDKQPFRTSCLVEVSTSLTGGGNAGRVLVATEIYE